MNTNSTYRREQMIAFEALEDRQLMSSSIVSSIVQPLSEVIARFKDAISQNLSHKKNDAKTTRKLISEIRYNSQLLGVNDKVRKAAETLIKKGGAEYEDRANRMIVIDALKLPVELRNSQLKAKELLEDVAALQAAGGGEKQSDPAFWQRVRRVGAEVALGEVVAENLNIPGQIAKGRTAKDLLKDAGDIQLLGGDVSKLHAWQGIELVKAGKISAEQYAKDYTNDKPPANSAATKATTGSGIVSRVIGQVSDFVSTIGRVGGGSQNAAGSAGAGSAVAPVSSAPVNSATQAPAAGQVGAGPTGGSDAPTGQVIGTVSNVHNQNGTSTYTLTTTFPDGSTAVQNYVVHEDGSVDVYDQDGNLTQHFPPGSGDPMPDGAEGHSFVMDEDTDGDGDPDSGTYYYKDDDHDGQPDDDSNNDNGDDSKKDDSNSEGSSNDTEGENSGSESAGEPNPENISGDIGKSVGFYLNNPVGRGMAGGLIDPVKSSPTHGAGDPTEDSVNYAGAPDFYAHFGGAPSMKNTGGAVDYADQPTYYVIVDKQLLKALQIRAGGAVGGPDVGRKPTAPQAPQGSPAPAPTPVPTGGTTAVFATGAAIKLKDAAATLSPKVSASVLAH